MWQMKVSGIKLIAVHNLKIEFSFYSSWLPKKKEVCDVMALKKKIRMLV